MLTGPLPKHVDHRKLADQKAELEGEIAIGELSRFASSLASTEGDIRVRLKFRQGKKHRTLVLGEVGGQVEMICQACLEPMTLTVRGKIRTLLVPTLEEMVEMDQGEDAMVCETDEVRLADLIEDELMVSLPMVPRHDEGECAPIASTEVSRPQTYKPFAGLDKLIKGA